MLGVFYFAAMAFLDKIGGIKMKTFLKRFGFVLFLGVMGVLTAVGANFVMTPWTINLFFYRAVFEIAIERPELLTSLRVLDAVGVKFHNDDLDPSGPKYTDRLIEKIENYKLMLASYDNSELDDSEKLSKQVLQYLFGFFDQWKEFRYHNYPVNQLFGVQSSFPEFMESKHVIESPQDAEDYITRLQKLEKKFRFLRAVLLHSDLDRN